MSNSDPTVQIKLSEKQIAQHLEQVAAISQNARGTWFSLILVLLFSAIAVAGVEDKDFFVFGAGLNLPVIGYTVPVSSFFYAAPVIVLGLYAYLHLYLLNLWRLLGELPCSLPDDRALDDAVYPWIATNAVISLKQGNIARPFAWLTRLVVFALVWAAAPGVLLYIWWCSVVPHDLWLTSWTGLLASAAIMGGILSIITCLQALRKPASEKSTAMKDVKLVTKGIGFATIILVLFAGYFRIWGTLELASITFGNERFVYSAQLYRVELVERPDDWLPYDEAFEKFKVQYSRKSRNEIDDLSEEPKWLEKAENAFNKERLSLIESLTHKELRGVDLRRADLREAFLAGVDMTKADLSGAQMDSAILERAELNDAKLNRAVLNNAKLNDAELNDAELNDAELNDAKLNNAKLNNAELNDAKLKRAVLNNTKLNRAVLNRAELNYAVLNDAVLNDAMLNDAVLNFAVLNRVKLNNAKLNRAVLNGARMSFAKLNRAELNGAKLNNANLHRAELIDAVLNNAMLNFAVLNGARMNNAELNGAVLNGAELNFAVLNRAELNDAELNDAVLYRAALINAELNFAKLNDAFLNFAELYWVELNNAKLNRAVLNGARMNDAVLNDAFLNNAVLNDAELYDAELNGARMNFAKLNRAVLNGAELNKTDLANASIQFAFARSVDLSKTQNLTQGQINSMFAVGVLQLPDGLDRPDHWINEELSSEDADQRWLEWRDAQTME